MTIQEKALPKVVSTNRDRFVRIVEKRVNRILTALDSLGNCSNKKNYEYSQEDIRKVFGAIDKKTSEIRMRFQDQPKDRATFRLG
jgi:hypothetical protein